MLEACYLVYGGEPLQTEEYISTIKHLAEKHDYNKYMVFEVNAQFNWEQLLNTCQNLDLFAERTVVELRLHGENISKQGTQTLEQMLQEQPKDICVIVRASKLKPQVLNQNWVKLIQKHGKSYQAKPISSARWPEWIAKRLQQANFKPSADTIDCLASYYEGNLPAASQCIQKLQAALASGPLTTQQIEPFMVHSTHFSIFDLSEAAINGDSKRTFSIFHSLKDEGVDPILVLWSATRELRNLLQLSYALQTGASLSQSAQNLGIWRENIPNLKLALDRLSTTNLQNLIKTCKTIDTTIKGITTGDAWALLLTVYLTLASGKILTMEELNI